MNYKRYKIEIILASSLLFMLMAYGYKVTLQNSLNSSKVEISQAKMQVNQIIALQELWGDKALNNKVKSLENMLPKEKIENFAIKSKKLHATYKALSIDELNRLTNKVVALAFVIEKFHLTKEEQTYRLELICKW